MENTQNLSIEVTERNRGIENLLEDLFFPMDFPVSIPLCELVPTYMEDLL